MHLVLQALMAHLAGKETSDPQDSLAKRATLAHLVQTVRRVHRGYLDKTQQRMASSLPDTARLK